MIINVFFLCMRHDASKNGDFLELMEFLLILDLCKNDLLGFYCSEKSVRKRSEPKVSNTKIIRTSTKIW